MLYNTLAVPVPPPSNGTEILLTPTRAEQQLLPMVRLLFTLHLLQLSLPQVIITTTPSSLSVVLNAILPPVM